MGKRKKSSNELDAILEQLKRSYSTDPDTELEDSLLDSEPDEEDEELSSVLSKIFSDFEESSKISESTDNDESGSAIEEQNETERSVEQKETIIENTTPENTQLTSADSESAGNEPTHVDTKEQQEVDDVLSAMLHRTIAVDQPKESSLDIPAEESDVTSTNDVLSLVIATDNESVIESEDTDDTAAFETDEAEPIPASDISEPDTEPDNSLVVDDTVKEEISEEISEKLSEEISEEISEDTAYEPDDEVVDKTTADLVADDIIDEPISYSLEEYTDEDMTEELDADIAKAIIVLDPEEYTSDSLQLGLGDLSLMKVDEDIDESQFETKKEEPITNEADDASLDSNDVSLLLKFGYSEEVNAQIGRDKAKKVIFDKESNFTPEPHKVPFGFTGKEYSSREQDGSIRQKYKNDRFVLLISLIAISALTLISFVFGIIFEFAPNRIDYYFSIMSLDFVFVSIAALICGKRLVCGAIGISKFESDPYSILLLLSAEYLVYNVVVAIVYAIDPILLYNSYSWISGSCILAYFVITTLCDLVNCDKEFKTFEMLSRSDAIYTVEKLSPSDEVGDQSRLKKGQSNAAPGTYRVRKTSMIGGYFKKISESALRAVSPVYALGVVPSIALALGCFVAVSSGNVVHGVHTFIMSTVLCLPLSSLALSSVNGYINAKKYKACGAAFIGQDSQAEYASVSMLVFDDTEAVEITSYKEINSGKYVGDAQQNISVAYNVFKTLNGPFGEIVPGKYMSENGHELIINTISDNGINVYFDSSTNILIGDKQYMLAHNIKVKTDVSLTTATKGADRYVIYMAFDGKPQLGFVLTQKVKTDFSKIISILADSGIAMAIESYEPEVNDLYFEQNKTSDYSVITVHKPTRYQKKTHDAVCDGTLIAKDTLSLASAISKCKSEPARKQRIRHANLISFIIGGALSSFIALIMCFNIPIGIFDSLREHPYIAFLVSIVLSAIPAVINTVKEHLRK